MKKLKTIDIQAKEWFDKANGNSYFSGEITLNFGMDDVETFIINMQTAFVPSEVVDGVLRIVGNLKEESSAQTMDDGVSQSVTAKAGIAKVENVKLPNPITQAPYRTFLEVQQPESKFVIRIRKGQAGPSCALFEADGGAWELEAVLRIKEWLQKELPKISVIA